MWTALGKVGVAACADGKAECSRTISLAGGGTRTANLQIGLPNMWFAYERPKYLPSAFSGTLLDDKQTATGTHYRRNRYYDPGAGRFTQEDPIGLAGGLNLYGFAGSNPANFSDPFGLCPSCVGAATGVATGWAIAQLTRSDYTWKDAATDAALGAVGAGLASKAGTLGRLAFGAEEAAERSSGKVVIGDHERVRAFAQKADAGTFETDANTVKQMWKENSTWLRKALRDGKEVIDIGEQPGRAVRSPFYKAEKAIIERRGYPVTSAPQP